MEGPQTKALKPEKEERRGGCQDLRGCLGCAAALLGFPAPPGHLVCKPADPDMGARFMFKRIELSTQVLRTTYCN